MQLRAQERLVRMATILCGTVYVDYLNRVWQKLMIRVARANRIRSVIESRLATADLVGRYTAGSSPSTGVQRAQILSSRRLRSSLFFAGEYVRDVERIASNVRATLELVQLLAAAGLDLHVSVDPTAIGYLVDADLCAENAVRIATTICSAGQKRPGMHCLMLDMEDESLVDFTIALHDRLKSLSLPVALTLQAYLRRTQKDLQREIELGSSIRLVKGAFAAGSATAYTGRRRVSEQYRELTALMLSEAVAHPAFYPIFATHDDSIYCEIAELANAHGLPKERFEFEMLMGVKPELANSLAGRGYTVRLYVPCGPDWWGYVNRGLGESPRNAVLLLKAICA